MPSVLRHDRCTTLATCGSPSRSAMLLGGLLVVYLSALCYGTHTPLTQLPIKIHNDRLYHFAAYFVLAAIVRLMLGSWKPSTLSTCVISWAMVAVVAVLDETTQPLVGRHFDIKDIAADWFGAATAILLTHLACLVMRRNVQAAEPPRPATLIVPRRRPTNSVENEVRDAA